MNELRIRFSYRNGTADENRLDLYDGTVSMGGVARVLTIATHAFVNGEVRTRGDLAHGATLYLKPPKRGSFEFDAVVVWVLGATSSGVFYDFLKYCFSEAVGIPDAAEKDSAALWRRIEPTLGELPAVLENPLRDVHRPIRQQPSMTLTVQRPRGEELITFDARTDSYLQPHDEPLMSPVTGNVTRYNTLSRWGKIYSGAEGRVVSFLLDESISERERSLITWSLHESNLGRAGKLLIGGKSVVTPSGFVKRYNVDSVGVAP